MDYASNSKKTRAGAEGTPAQPEKKIEAIEGLEVIVRKKPVGRRLKEFLVGPDAKSAVQYIIHEVLIPGAKDIVFDVITKGAERRVYGDRAARRHALGKTIGSRVIYNTPPNRQLETRSSVSARTERLSTEDFIFRSKDEAESVLGRMGDVLDQYQVVTVLDLNDICGFKSNPVQNNYGWTFLVGASVRRVRDGWLLDLPPAEPI